MDNVSYEVKLESNALCAKVGDSILDVKTMLIGVVTKKGQSGNEDLIYVTFTKPGLHGLQRREVRINPMMDAQCVGRYYKLNVTEYKEEE